jgi:hypothetical protein
MEYELVPWRRYGHDRVYIKVGTATLGHLDRASGQLHLEGTEDRDSIEAALMAAGHLSQSDVVAPVPPLITEPAAPAPTPIAPSAPIERGSPGASLQKEADRQRRAREERVRGAHPKLGGLMLKVSKEPVKTRNLAQGAAGERRIAARLEELCGRTVSFLHNRLCGVARRDGDIDHIAIAPSGIYVIDAKYYPGASVEVRRSGGLLSPRVEELFIRGRNKTSLLVSLQRQHAAVKEALADLQGAEVVPLFSAFCFLDAELPLLWSERIQGVPLLGPRRMAKLIRQEGPMNEGHRQRLLEHLAAKLPPAG